MVATSEGIDQGGQWQGFVKELKNTFERGVKKVDTNLGSKIDLNKRESDKKFHDLDTKMNNITTKTIAIINNT